MRFIVKFSFPLEPFNTYVRTGAAGEKVQQVLEAIGPESVYFWEDGGKRGGIMIVDLDKPSQVPSVAEPLFLTFDAEVEFHPAMTPEDLGAAGLDEIGRQFA